MLEYFQNTGKDMANKDKAKQLIKVANVSKPLSTTEAGIAEVIYILLSSLFVQYLALCGEAYSSC